MTEAFGPEPQPNLSPHEQYKLIKDTTDNARTKLGSGLFPDAVRVGAIRGVALAKMHERFAQAHGFGRTGGVELPVQQLPKVIEMGPDRIFDPIDFEFRTQSPDGDPEKEKFMQGRDASAEDMTMIINTYTALGQRSDSFNDALDDLRAGRKKIDEEAIAEEDKLIRTSAQTIKENLGGLVTFFRTHATYPPVDREEKRYPTEIIVTDTYIDGGKPATVKLLTERNQLLITPHEEGTEREANNSEWVRFGDTALHEAVAVLPDEMQTLLKIEPQRKETREWEPTGTNKLCRQLLDQMNGLVHDTNPVLDLSIVPDKTADQPTPAKRQFVVGTEGEVQVDKEEIRETQIIVDEHPPLPDEEVARALLDGTAEKNGIYRRGFVAGSDGINDDIEQLPRVTITIPESPEPADLFAVAEALYKNRNPMKQEVYAQFAGLAKDAAIVMTKHELLQDPALDHVVEIYYNLGRILNGENSDQTITKDEIAAMELDINDDMERTKREDDALLFMIGKPFTKKPYPIRRVADTLQKPSVLPAYNRYEQINLASAINDTERAKKPDEGPRRSDEAIREETDAYFISTWRNDNVMKDYAFEEFKRGILYDGLYA